MVWVGISHSVKSQLMVIAGKLTAVRYRNDVLCPFAVLLIQQRQFILQRDTGRSHVAKVCRKCLVN